MTKYDLGMESSGKEFLVMNLVGRFLFCVGLAIALLACGDDESNFISPQGDSSSVTSSSVTPKNVILERSDRIQQQFREVLLERDVKLKRDKRVQQQCEVQ